jgi:hypothetical protein
VLAAAIGIYLPLETMVPIFLGGLLNWLVTRSFGKDLSEDEIEKRNRRGTLYAAGLITGEALMGIFMGVAIYSANKGVANPRPDVLALPQTFQILGPAGGWVGLALLGLVGWWLYKAGLNKSKTS